MKKLRKIISVFLVVLMVFTSVPVQGFAGLEPSDWFSAPSSAIDGKEETSSDISLPDISSDGTVLDNAPIKDKLDFQAIRGQAQAKAESFNDKVFGNGKSDESGDGIIVGKPDTEEPDVSVGPGGGDVGTEPEEPQSEVEWSYDETTHTLTISGVGPMDDYMAVDDFSVETPWFGISEEIEKIVISEGITYIGAFAFALCVNVTEVVIPDTVIEIGAYAFCYCVDLENIDLPDSLLSIGEYCFGLCWSLKEIIIPESVVSIGEGAFTMCVDVTKVVLPSSIKNTGDYIFDSLYSVKEFESSLELGGAIIYINDIGAYPIALEKLVNNSDETVFDHGMEMSFDDVKYADAYAYFNICAYKAEYGEELEIFDYTIAQAIKDIVIYANENLGTNYDPDTASVEDVQMLMESIEEHIIDVNYAAFTMVYCTEESAQHTYCKENTISHTIIGESEACVCFELGGNLGEDVTWTFDTDTRTLIFDGQGEMEVPKDSRYRTMATFVENVEFKDGSAITNLADGAFYNMKNLKEVTLPEGMISIGEQCFYNSGLEVINLPASLTMYDTLSWYTGTAPLRVINVAEGNDSLVTYEDSLYQTIPLTETEMLYMLLKQPEAKAGIFKENTVAINSCAFENYSTVTEITIPDTVVVLGDAVFMSCSSLETINIGNTIPLEFDGEVMYLEMSEMSIYECYNLVAINVDENNEAYASVDGVLYNKDITELISCPSGKTSIVLPETVERVRGAYNGLVSNKLAEVKILNPDCEIYDDSYTINPSAVIYGYKGSTAEAYADKYSRKFEYIEGITVESIEVNTANAKTNYNQFEAIELSGLIVTVNYSDGTSAVKTTGIKAVEFDTSDLGTSQVTVEYRGVTAQYEITVSCPEILLDSYTYINFCKDKITYIKYTPEKTGSYSLNSSYSTYFERTVAVYDDGMNKLTEQVFTEGEMLSFVYDYESGKTYYIGISTNLNYDYGSFHIQLVCAHNYTDEVISETTCGFDGSIRRTCSVCGYITTETHYATAQHVDEDSNNVCDVCSVSLVCGEGITWSIDENGKLTIAGSGEITSYPWSKHRAIIKSLVISEGITSVCDSAFYNSYNLEIASIPASVTTIGEEAFYYCSNLKTVTFAQDSQLQTIGDEAFYNCYNLKTVTFAQDSQLQAIGDYAFSSCYGLTEITIPASVTSIGECAFYDSARSGINVDPENTVYTSEDGILYSKDKTVLIQYPRYKEDSSFEVPASVTTIGVRAFSSCNNLKTVTFAEDSQLQTIGNYAFDYCYALTEITIPASVTTISGYAFRYCSNLKTVTFAEGSQLQNIGDYAFSYCYALTEITMPASVTTIGNYVFSGCNVLTAITIPASVTSVNSYSFMGCSSLVAINVEEGNTRYASLDGVLYNADFTTLICCPVAITEVVVPETVTYIEYGAFYNSRVQSITFLCKDFSWGYNIYFSNSPVIYCYPNSSAENFADYFGLQIEYLDDITIESIEIDRAKTKTTYTQYENFNTSDVSLIINYSDGTSVTKTGGFTLSGNNTNEAGTHTVVVTYKDFTAEYEITVNWLTVTYNSTARIRLLAGKTSYVKYVPAATGPITLTSSYANGFARTVVVCDDGMNKLDEKYFAQNENITYTYNYEAGNTYYIGISLDYEYDYGSIYIYFSCAHNYIETVETVRTCGADGRTRFDCVVCGGYRRETTYATAQHVDADSDNVCDVCSVSLVCGEGITWSIDENGVLTINGLGAITSYPWYRHRAIIKSVVISEGITSVCDSAFNYCYNLETASIPASVISIGHAIFEDCYKLSEVSFAEGSQLQTIGVYAFAYCGALEEITIPASVTTIGEGAFVESGLKEINVDPENTVYTSENGVLYSKDKTVLIQYPQKKVNTTFEIPASVTTIGDYAFRYCNNLKTVTFAEDSQLQTIGSNTFCDCDALEEITIPEGVTTIGEEAFYSCNNLKTVTFAEGSQLQTIGNYAFCYCNSLTGITIPASVTTIGYGAFGDCRDLKTVTFAEGSQLQTIGNYAFNNCDALEEITIPECVTTIGDCAFRYCDSLTEITIPASVTTIGEEAFYNCRNLKTVTFAEDSQLQTIVNGAFYDCNALAEITIPASVTTIGTYAFYSCDALQKITFLNPETSISNYSDTISSTATIYGYANSTAYTYATNYGRTFVELECPHNNTEDYEEVSPDCIINGATAGTYCSFCKRWVVGREDIPALGHEETWIVEREATCVEAGLEVKYCTRCEKKLFGNVVCDPSTYPESPHNYANGQTYNYSFSYPGAKKLILKFSAETNTESGYDYIYIYNADGSLHSYYSGSQLTSKEIELQGDSFSIKLTTDGSAVRYGFSFDSITAVGLYDDEYSREIPALGHEHSDEWFIDVEPTCTEPGSKSHKCVRCEDKIDVTVIEATGHDYESVVTEPDCITDGYTTHTCSVCGDEYTDSVVPATGHDFSDWEVTTEPDCINNGEKIRTCSACEYFETETIEALGHAPSGEWVVETEPTCTEKGLEIQYCSRCNNKLMGYIVCDPSTYPETPHDYANSQTYNYSFSYPGAQKLILKFSAETNTENNYDYIYIYKADGSLYGKYCDSQLASKEIELEGDSFSIKLTTDYSVVRYGFSFDSITAVGYYDDSCTREIPALGHDLDEEWNVETEPTCMADGENVKRCSRCDYIERDVVPALGHVTVAVPAEFPIQCDVYETSTLKVKCTRCLEELTDGDMPDTISWKLNFDTGAMAIPGEGNSEIIIFSRTEDGQVYNMSLEIGSKDIFVSNNSVTFDIECEGVPFAYIHKLDASGLVVLSYDVTLCSVDSDGNDFAVWTHSYSTTDTTKENGKYIFSTQSQHILEFDSVVREPSCFEKGEEIHICTVCGAEKNLETPTVEHTYEDTVYDPTCIDNGYTEHNCSVCGHTFKDAATEALGHEYESKHIDAENDKDGYTLYECIRCDESYVVLDPAVPVDGLYATGEAYKISLSWLKAVEVSVTGYEVFRKAPEDSEYVKVKVINSRNTTSYVDKDVVAGYEYLYKVRAMKDSVEGEFCEAVAAVALSDTTAPRVIKLEANKSIKDTITGTVSFNLNAEDDIGISKYMLYVRAEGAEEWIYIGEKEGTTCSISFDTRTVEDGIYDFRATAYDAMGNCDEVGLTKQYRIDNTGPAKITGLTAIEIYSSRATLSWQNTAEKDVHHFVLRREIITGDTISYIIINNNITEATGYYLTDLTPETTYTYSVAGVDEFGNMGEYSEPFSLTTVKDEDAPYIKSLSPSPGRYNSVINFNVTAEDDYNIASIVVQESYDSKIWTAIDTRTFTGISKTRKETFNISLADIPEGAYYLRAIAYDSENQSSTTDNTASFVQYFVDKTAPAAPVGIVGLSKDGYIEIKWNDSTEVDRYNYFVYRSDSAEGPFALIKSNVNSLNYFDRNIERGKTYYYKVAVNDYCNNMSELSEAVSVKAMIDTQKPEIFSIQPSSGTFVGESKKSVGVKAYDNNMLSKIVLEYKTNKDDGYIVLATKTDINNSEGVLNTQLPINGLGDGEKIYIRAYCEDVSGYKSDYSSEYVYTVDRTAPSVSNLNVSAQADKVTVSWSDNKESDLAGFYVYRSNNDGEYQRIKSFSYKSSHSYSFTETLGEGTYTYRIDAIDVAGNTASYYSDSLYVEKVIVIIPKIDSVSYFEAGVQEQFSSANSTSTNMITEYKWDFGDGTTSSEPNPVKSYDKSGNYTVTLTITDLEGNTASVSKDIVVKEREMLGTVKIRVLDNNGTPLSGMPVYFDMGTDDQYILLTDRYGYVTSTMTAGFHEIGSFRYDDSGKANYLPASVNVNVLAGATVEEKITLIQKDLITGVFEVREMTIDEILAAGINPKDENNQQIYTVTVHLEYGETQMVINYIRNDRGIIQQNGYVVPGGGEYIPGGGGNVRIPEFVYIPNDYGVEIITTLDIPVKASYLKQFYYASLYILNNADPGFKIVDCLASLDISPESGLAIYSHEPIATVIDGQKSSTATWILRGDEAGDYDLTATFTGILERFKAPVKAEFKESVNVRAMEDTISILVETPEYIFINPDENCDFPVSINDPDKEDDTAVIGTQYKFQNVIYYNIGMRNICDSDIYYPTITTDGNVTIKINGEPVPQAITERGKTYIEKDGVRTEVDPDDIKILGPGEMLIAYYKVYNFEVIRDSDDERKKIENLSEEEKAERDELPDSELRRRTEQEYVYQQLTDYFTYNPSNPNVKVDFDINNQLFYDYYFADENSLEEATITYSTVEYGMDKTHSYVYSDDFFKSDSRTYNADLAELSLGVAASAYGDAAYQDGFYANLESDNNSRATNVLKTYKQLGFTDTEFRNYDVTLSDYSDKVAYSMAKKYITNEDGTVDTLVALFVRGGNYGSEWTSNFHVSEEATGNRDHIGFSNAAKKVTADFHSYVASLQEQDKIQGELKLWMTSYSRGAATTNLVAHNLNSVGVVGGVPYDIEDAYIYTFATPRGAYDPEKSTVDDSNIFNIISPLDFVPQVALDAWGYGRYGNTLVLPIASNVSGTFAKFEGVKDLYSVSPEQFAFIEIVVYGVAPLLIPSSTFYEHSLQSTVMYAFSLMNSGLNLSAGELCSRIIAYYVDNFELTIENIYVSGVILGLVALVVGIVVGNIGTIVKYVVDNIVDILLGQIKDAVKDFIKDLVEKIIISVVPGWSDKYEKLSYSFSFSGLKNAHYTTYYMAALQECGYESADDFGSIFNKMVRGACPVDLNVYDENGELVASIIDDEVVLNDIPACVIGDEKIVILDENNYRLEWIGSDEGTMDYTIYEFDGEGSLARTASFYNVPLEDDLKYEQEISAGILDKEEEYSLYCNGEEIETDFDTLLPKGETHKITVVDGISNVEQAAPGEEVTVIANRETESAFVMWVADGEVEFKDAAFGVTSFVMPDEDVTIYAVYAEDLISSVVFNEDHIDMMVGESKTLDINVDKADAILQNFEWTSSDESIVSVDNGNIYANAAGQAQITVTETFSGVSAVCSVFVNENTGCEHKFSDWQISVNATCETDGEEYRECSVCHEKQTNIITAKGHDYETVVTNPTCTAGGYTTYTCKACGEGYSSDITEPIGHKWIDAGDGLTKICSLCGKVVVTECTHSYHPFVTPPTCTSNGYTTYICQICNSTYIADETAATGHNYQNGVCTNCGDDRTENCSCKCHSKSFITKFIWKVLRFFYKLLRMKKYCECGAIHY